MNLSTAHAVASQFIEDVLTVRTLRGDAIVRLTRVLRQTQSLDAHHILLGTDGLTETRAQIDELAQQAEGSHRQHMGKTDAQ